MISYIERRNLLTQTLTFRSSPTACQRCWPSLHEYIAAQLAGQPYVALFPDIALHLDACVACAEAYALLYELAVVEARAALPQLVQMPEPSLLFLAPVPMQWLQQVQAGLQKIGEQLSLQLTPALAATLRPAYAASTLRGAAEDQRYREPLLQLEPDQTLQNEWPIKLMAYRDALQPTNCLVEVTVEPPDRTWPELEGINVTLSFYDDKRSLPTDAWGLASFLDIPITWLPELRVAVTL